MFSIETKQEAIVRTETTNESRALARVETEVIEGVVVDVESNVTPGSHLISPLMRGSDLTARVDLLQLLLDNSSSDATKKTYRQGWKFFFGGSPRLSPLWEKSEAEAVWAFCQLSRQDRQLEAYEFRARMEKQKCAPSTIQNRQSAVRQILKFAHTLGWCDDDGANLFPHKKVVTYNDTRGIGWERAKILMQLPTSMHAGDDEAKKLLRLRDTAILNLMCQCALRNMSVRALTIGDWSYNDATLWVTEKGRGGSKRIFDISDELNEAILDYVTAAGHRHQSDKPLFMSLKRGSSWNDGPISSNGLGHIVRAYKEKMGLTKLYPHRLRHTSIAQAAKNTNGDLLAIKDLSGHADIRTVEIYARQAKSRQGEISRKLAQDLKE